MNKELENLVELSLVDGYISDKEREVLKRKAASLGFDVEELEIILDGRLYEKNKSMLPKINKCPNCGEVITGFARICNACDYILNTQDIEDYESLEESFSDLEELVDDLKTHKNLPGATPLFAANLKIFFTGGLYILYKKLIKKEPIYDSYRKVNKSIIKETDAEVMELKRKYGNNAQTNAAIEALISQRDSIINERRRSDLIKGLINFTIWAGIFGFIYYWGSLPPAPPTTEENLLTLIEQKKISDAKAMLAKLGDDSKNGKDYYIDQIQLLEIDSLAGSGNYDEALRLANTIKDGDYSQDRRDKIDEIITKEVTELIEKKEFKKAKKRAELASYMKKSGLDEKINLAENLK